VGVKSCSVLLDSPPSLFLPHKEGGNGAEPCVAGGVSLAEERVPVVDPTPASPRLIAGLSKSANAGPIGSISGRCAFDFGVLLGFLEEVGGFAISGIWDELAAEERVWTNEEPAPQQAVCAVSSCQERGSDKQFKNRHSGARVQRANPESISP
jgi:hypothetical protein